MSSLVPSSRLNNDHPIVRRTGASLGLRPSALALLNLHNMPKAALLYILGDRTLDLLDLRLVVSPAHTWFMHLLLQGL